ncbi:MAG: GFA family protein [Bdellovibrionota bacterium]
MKTHTGSCHCGKVKFSVEMNLKNALSCNCSICLKRGSLLDFVPESQFTLLSGGSELQEYLFNKHVIRHQFCKTCGILPFAKAAGPDGTKMVALNLRCIEGIEIKDLNIQEYDGRSR